MMEKSQTPTNVPTSPPAPITPAMVKSTALRRHCASAPEMEDAVMWLRVVATAMAEGMP